MKILFVLDKLGLFGNPKDGGSHRNTMFVKALTKLGHVDVCSFSEEAVASDIDDCDVVYSNQYMKKESIGNKYIYNALSLLKVLFFPSNPNSYFKTSVEKEKIVDELVNQGGYDLIACHYIDSAIICGLLKYGAKLVVDVDDNLSSVYRYLASIKRTFFRKKKYILMANLVPLMNKRVLDNIFCSFYSNILEPPSHTSVFLHNSVICKANVPDISTFAPNRIVFIGHLNFPPNIYGVNHFVNCVFPMIRQRVSDVELHVIGKGSKDFLDELNQVEGVKALGFVEDIAAEYKDAKAVVLPIYHGAGTSIKFVEAMYMNRPIVSAPVGARGFDRIAKDGEHFLLANSDEEFANKTVELLSSIDKANEMADKAYELAKANFSQDKFVEIVKTTIEEKLKQK